MKLFNFLKRKTQFVSGALSDPRIIEERLKDFRFEELVTTPPIVDWKEKPISECKIYEPIRSQSSSGSCVAFSKALELGILNKLEKEEQEFVILSARDIYTRRKNQDRPGMWGQDANQICINNGTTLEPLMSSDNKNEVEMNKTDDRKPHKEMVGKIFRAKNWIALPFDMDTIASVLATGKGVNLFFRFAYSEWNRPIPVLSTKIPDCHHSVVAIDYIRCYGKKALIIQDSWSLANTYQGRRIITEDWIKRITWASYFIDLSNLDLLNQPSQKLPYYVFTKDLFSGMRGDEVRKLQVILSMIQDNEGYLFPLWQGTNTSGYFGGITREAVKRFQKMYNLPITGYFEILTRTMLNKLLK